MVVRATISATINAVVYRLPYSDRLPERVKTLMGSGTSKLEQIEIAPEEVRPLVTPSQKIRMKMLEKRAGDTLESPNLSSLSRNAPPEIEIDSEETVKETDSQHIRQARVELYLTEQHDEFTTLINKNLKEVMQQQQQKYADETSWRRLVLELAMARNSDEATQKLNLMLARAQDSVFSYVPFVRGEKHTRNILDDYENSALKMETAELLDQLDYESKITLLRQLMVDLGMRAEADDIVNFTRGSAVLEETLMTDKVELLTLVAVRLWFLGLRYLLPLTRLLYTKFKENDILLLNNRNFSKLLTVLVRLMESLEEKLNPQASPARPASLALTDASK